MIKSEEKIIDGVNYTVTQFPARRGIKIQTKLAKLLGPTFAALNTGKGSILDQDVGNLSGAVNALVGRLDEDYVVNFVLELLMCTRREGKEITEGLFDTVYAGNYKELYKAILFVLEVNYGSFMKELGTFAAQGSQKNQASAQEE